MSPSHQVCDATWKPITWDLGAPPFQNRAPTARTTTAPEATAVTASAGRRLVHSATSSGTTIGMTRSLISRAKPNTAPARPGSSDCPDGGGPARGPPSPRRAPAARPRSPLRWSRRRGGGEQHGGGDRRPGSGHRARDPVVGDQADQCPDGALQAGAGDAVGQPAGQAEIGPQRRLGGKDVGDEPVAAPEEGERLGVDTLVVGQGAAQRQQPGEHRQCQAAR